MKVYDQSKKFISDKVLRIFFLICVPNFKAIGARFNLQLDYSGEKPI
jgi:hypothetical protein